MYVALAFVMCRNETMLQRGMHVGACAGWGNPFATGDEAPRAFEEAWCGVDDELNTSDYHPTGALHPDVLCTILHTNWSVQIEAHEDKPRPQPVSRRTRSGADDDWPVWKQLQDLPMKQSLSQPITSHEALIRNSALARPFPSLRFASLGCEPVPPWGSIFALVRTCNPEWWLLHPTCIPYIGSVGKWSPTSHIPIRRKTCMITIV